MPYTIRRQIGIERAVSSMKTKKQGKNGYIKIFKLVYQTAPLLSTVHLLISLLIGSLVAVQVSLWDN